MDRATRFIIGVQWSILVLVLVLMFRPNVASLIDRITKLGKDGVEIGPQKVPLNPDQTAPGPVVSPPITAGGGSGVASGEKAAADPGSPKQSLVDLIPPLFRPLVLQQFQRQKERMQNLRGMVDESEVDVALNWAAELASALLLERASKSVYQSQLNALEDLHYTLVSKDSFRPFYEWGRRANPKAYEKYTFDNWFDYLIYMGLVAGTNDAIRVTHAGEALQMYMKQQGYSAAQA
jgi:hypothetical protein